MSGSYETTAALNAEVIADLGTTGAGSITPAIVQQFILDAIATTMPSETTLAYSSSLAWALDTNPVARVVLTGNTTITLSAGQNGDSYRLVVVQNGTGGWTVAISGATVLGSPVWNTAANGVNIISSDVSNGVRYVGVL